MTYSIRHIQQTGLKNFVLYVAHWLQFAYTCFKLILLYRNKSILLFMMLHYHN